MNCLHTPRKQVQTTNRHCDQPDTQNHGFQHRKLDKTPNVEFKLFLRNLQWQRIHKFAYRTMKTLILTNHCVWVSHQNLCDRPKHLAEFNQTPTAPDQRTGGPPHQGNVISHTHNTTENRGYKKSKFSVPPGIRLLTVDAASSQSSIKCGPAIPRTTRVRCSPSSCH